MKVPLSRPIIGDAERQAVLEVLDSGMLASGPRVQRFEEAFAGLCQTEHAVALGSGTAALYLGLLASGVGPGDEVIVPSFTFAASANSVAMCGATPVFIDVDESTFCVTPAGIAAAITDRTKGVMVVHLYGHPAPMPEIMAVADRAGIDVYEDAAQAHGATSGGRPVGGWGRFGAFSFYPTKNMTTGEGGMVTTRDPAIADRVRLLRNQGMRGRYEHEIIGLNERMTDIEGAIGLVQLEGLQEWTASRVRNADAYRSDLLPILRPPPAPENGTHVYHQFTIRPPDRAAAIEALEAAGIGYGVYYPVPTHRQPQFGDQPSLPITERLAEEVLSIPVRPDLTDDEIQYVIATLNGVIES